MSIIGKNFKVGDFVFIKNIAPSLNGIVGEILGKGIQGITDMYIVCTKEAYHEDLISDKAILLAEGNLELVGTK